MTAANNGANKRGSIMSRSSGTEYSGSEVAAVAMGAKDLLRRGDAGALNDFKAWARVQP